jgi:hypothetical protein
VLLYCLLWLLVQLPASTLQTKSCLSQALPLPLLVLPHMMSMLLLLLLLLLLIRRC